MLLLLAGCIHNDLPYPRLVQSITAISAEGELKPAVIDSVNLNATVYLEETVDIEAVRFDRFEISPGAECSPNLLEGVYNMKKPIVVNVSLYQNYQWTVTAVQEIERYLTVKGEIGETVFDEVGHRIIIRVPMTANLASLEVTSIKIGPEGLTTLSPDITVGKYDFSRPVRVAVTAFGRTEDWTIYVEKMESMVETVRVEPWSQVIWASGTCVDGMKPGFMYRLESESEWTTLDESQLTVSGASFTGCIPHLTPLETYVVKAVGEDADGSLHEGEEVTVTMESTEVLPDGDFDQWWFGNYIWHPWPEDGVQFWDTGNKGTAMVFQYNVSPSDDTPTGTGKSAMLETKMVGMAGINRLATGSIYTGQFQKVEVPNGILDFGRPWKVRPTKLRGYFKYKTATITEASSDFDYLKGRPDSCHIYIAMTDWTAPFEIRTSPSKRNLFDKNASYVIAYGELIQGSDCGWQEFEIELKYRSLFTRPSYIQITCAASKYGDYFTGGPGATLWVDQLSLSYDY